MPNLAVHAQQLHKKFPIRRGWRIVQPESEGVTAVQSVDLAVETGEMFGLLGPNGAGKTTLVKMLCTLVLPTSGKATVGGYKLSDEAAIRATVGLVVTEERSFYWRLSARNNLLFFAAMFGMHGAEARKRVDAVLDEVNLLDRANTRFSDFSTGMRQRMAIARGILHRPKILFLDEPTRSLDPISTNNLHDLINQMRLERGLTVFLITHDLAEAEKMCDRVAVMHKGRVQGMGSSAELRSLVQPWRDYRLTVAQTRVELSEPLSRLVDNVQIAPGLVSFSTGENDDRLSQVLDFLRQRQVTITAIDAAQPSLEAVFSRLTTDFQTHDPQK